jgi:DNA-binding Lrp family transcriptional regulator
MSWTFLSNHAHVLVELAHDPDARLRDVAERVGITERAVQRIVSELEEAQVLNRFREGRRNRYEIDRAQELRHPIEQHCTVGDLLDMVWSTEEEDKRRSARPRRAG